MSYIQLSRQYQPECKPRMQTLYRTVITCSECRPTAEKFLSSHIFRNAITIRFLDRFADVKCDFCEPPCMEPAPCKCIRCE